MSGRGEKQYERDNGRDQRDRLDRYDRHSEDPGRGRWGSGEREGGPDRHREDGGPRRKRSRSRSAERRRGREDDRGRRDKGRNRIRSRSRSRDEGRERQRRRTDQDTVPSAPTEAAAVREEKPAAEREEPAVGIELDAELTAEEVQMMMAMGIPFGFDSTQGKHIQDDSANAGAVKVKTTRSARQFMNRKGGFNRPLPAEVTGKKVLRD